jgi:hypothetical protein
MPHGYNSLQKICLRLWTPEPGNGKRWFVKSMNEDFGCVAMDQPQYPPLLSEMVEQLLLSDLHLQWRVPTRTTKPTI